MAKKKKAVPKHEHGDVLDIPLALIDPNDWNPN